MNDVRGSSDATDSFSLLLDKGIELARAAQDDNISLRLVGGLGICSAIMDNQHLTEFLRSKRQPGHDRVFQDIDFICSMKDVRRLNEFFIDRLGFSKDRIVNALFGDVRRIYYSADGGYHVDIFIDRLEFNHTVECSSTINLSFPHLYPPDLLLSKLQVHFVNRKDLIDIIALTASGLTSNMESCNRICTVLSNDWGFYYDALLNMERTEAMLNEIHGEDIASDARSALRQLRELLETFPKSKAWQKRAKKGTARQWWNDVEEVAR